MHLKIGHPTYWVHVRLSSHQRSEIVAERARGSRGGFLTSLEANTTLLSSKPFFDFSMGDCSPADVSTEWLFLLLIHINTFLSSKGR